MPPSLMKPLVFGALALASLDMTTLAVEFCPPSGPLLPFSSLGRTSCFDGNQLNGALRSLLNSTNPPFDTSATSFSVTVTTPEKTFFQFHHTVKQVDEAGVAQADGDTVYRIASVTKLFTVLTVMAQEGLDIDSYVWEYVPELVGVESYRHTTLRMIASHIAGIPREGYVFDIMNRGPPNQFISLGFPNVTFPSDYITCDSPDTPLCSRSEFINGMLYDELTWLPGQTPTYSNYGFVILGFALETFTGKRFEDLVNEHLFQRLGMSSMTGFAMPNKKDMIIPKDGLSWAELDFSNWRATAGLYSTPNDLAVFLRSIMNAEILSPAETRAWLKPAAFTSSSSGDAVGMPWAIIRPKNVKRASGKRPLDIYSMLGSFPNYGAYVTIIPEYEVGIVVNVAGPGDDPAVRALLDIAVQHVVPAFDEAARTEASEKYAGSYGEPGSSLIIGLDDGPGLKIKEWTSNGLNVSDAWVTVSGEPLLASDVDMRLYPVGDGSERWQVSFRGISNEYQSTIFESVCQTWFSFDQHRYAGLSVDELSFIVGEDGLVKGLHVPGLRQNLTKAD